MSKENQFEEMAKIINKRCVEILEEAGVSNNECPFPYGCNECTARQLYDAGYRKQSENMVEVVRCKDCTHFQTINGRTLCSVNATRGEKLWLGLRATVEDGFCHHGEKMKGGADQ